MTTAFYNKYLLFIAGLGGLLYGIDVGVIAGALPYLQATTNYTAGELSSVVAAVLLGSVLSSLFAGSLAEWMGRKKLMIISGICFVLSVPVICIPTGITWLLLGRILQGVAGGLIGVVVPLYLAECLPPEKRGFGTGMFQFMLTIGLLFAALVGLACASYVDGVKLAGGNVFGAMEFAWKAIFWVCAVPGVIFSIGALAIAESARWLYKKGNVDGALAALTRSRGEEQAKIELAEMSKAESADKPEATEEADKPKDSLLQKKYIIPFVLAVVILACNQATGINSVLAYIVDVLRQAGLDGAIANWGDLVVKALNVVMTLVAMLLVDRLGRKMLLAIGTSGIILGLLGVAFLFWNSERKMEDVTAKIDAAKYAVVLEEAVTKAGAEVLDEQGNLVTSKNAYDFVCTLDPMTIKATTGYDVPEAGAQVKIVYSHNGGIGIKNVVVKPFAPTAEKPAPAGIIPTAEDIAAANAYVAEVKKQTEAWKNDLTVKIASQFDTVKEGDKEVQKAKTFKIESVEVGPLPGATNGWLVTFFFALFIATYAVGPGVCVWLALSELMPNRIRAVGMSVALLINQGVSTVIAGTFLPVVANWGYSTIFFFCAGCTVIYWITAVFFLPETKGRTLEEIEAHFEGKKKLN